QTRSYSNVPTVKGVQYAPLESSRLWLLPGGLFLALLCVAESYRRYLRRLERGPQDRPPDIDPRAPKMFRSAAIGGSPSPWLDDETLCELADSIGYFKSRQAGKRLDVAASVKTTLKHGGIPICEFFRRSRVRSLLILEDANAEALEWNRIAKELAAGLKRYGVPVIYGRFRGAPDTFDSDGHLRYLEDLEDRRNGMLLLLFTDGKSFYRPHNRFALEALAHWPMVAWVDLRDARFRDESVLPAYENKIPIYPATREGLLQAVKSFLSESGKILQIPPGPPLGKGGIGNDVLSKGGAGGISGEVDIERLLAEALPWAQDCTLMQPMPLGLADALRLKFHEDLPPERIEALFALPNSTRSPSGVRFSDAVLARLRRGLLKRRSDTERRERQQFILEHLEAARPDLPPDSLASLSWEARRERLRLEMGGDSDLQRFGELLQSPLAQSMADSLSGYVFADAGKQEGIPLLRQTPKNKKAQQRLGRVPGNPLALRPVPIRRHRIAQRVLTLLCGLCALATGLAFFRLPPFAAGEKPLNLHISGLPDTPLRLEMQENTQWTLVGEWSGTAELNKTSLTENAQYRLRLYGGGVWENFDDFEIRAGEQTQLTLDPGEIVKKCQEE
ncbi:MAG: hypothetical protein GY803_01340, partial [Chloroflexi bacterium]|nr:hypothetical protein [Chloroflexota bacterium]